MRFSRSLYFRSLYFGLVAALFHLMVVPPAQAQPDASPGDAPPIEVMVLGTYHFDDAPDVNDVMAPEQQAEIQAVVDSLAAFRPTKMALEWTRAEAARFDSLYAAYRAGTHPLTPNERQQLGFRLADRFDHDRVYAVDYKLRWPMDEVMRYAKKHDSTFVNYVEQWRSSMQAMQDSLQRHATIGEILHRYNRPATLDRIQAIRMHTLEVGAGSTYVGMKPVTSVYKRNFRIFANLTQIAEPGDRILFIFGAGHAYFFREFVSDHPNMTLVDPLAYL